MRDLDKFFGHEASRLSHSFFTRLKTFRCILCERHKLNDFLRNEETRYKVFEEIIINIIIQVYTYSFLLSEMDDGGLREQMMGLKVKKKLLNVLQNIVNINFLHVRSRYIFLFNQKRNQSDYIHLCTVPI